ncbi:MAG: hypothetical protein M1609_03550, partial [Firmicutes bacterium]|nr:hypothetical protein [Bacillota bacterium]
MLSTASSVGRETYLDLEKRARAIRRHIVNMIAEVGSGHPGGSLSAVEILTTLYFGVMKIDPNVPNDPERDRFGRETYLDLEKRARAIRRHIVNMIAEVGSGHPGGSLSAVEILT